MAVAFQHHHGFAARGRAEHLHGGHVDLPPGQRQRHLGDAAGGVVVVDDEGVGVPAKVGGHPVDGGDPDAPAPHRGGGQVQPAGGPFQRQDGGVGVGRAQLHRVDVERQPRLFGQGKTVGQAGVVRLHAQQPGHDGPVGAVAPAGGGKAAVQPDVGPDRRLAQKLAGRPADAGRAGGMAGGGPDHDRTQNVKQAHCVSNLAFRCKFGRLDGPARRKIQFYYTAFAPDVL